MSGSCKDCRHWYTHPCVKEKNIGSCQLATSSDAQPDNPSTLAWAEDTEQYSAWLNTKPEFGCVQFEEKESA